MQTLELLAPDARRKEIGARSPARREQTADEISGNLAIFDGKRRMKTIVNPLVSRRD